MSAARAHRPFDVAAALTVALGVQGAAAIALRGVQAVPHADLTDDNAKPVAVSITPMVDEDLPALKLGGKRDPTKLPDMWRAPAPVQRHEATAQPSDKARATAEAIPSARVSDAGAPPPDAALARAVDPMLATPPDAAAAPNLPTEGSPDGVKDGTETDPLKAHAVSLYKARLDGWFSSRFTSVRGRIPFDELAKLRADVRVTVADDRTVAGFAIVKPSGNATFDDALRATLAGLQSSHAELPPPPPLYPDILGQTLRLSFACTNRSLCE